MRDDAELADRVHRRLKDESAVNSVKVVRAIDEKVVRFRSLAINRISLPVAQPPSRFRYPRRQRNDSRLQQAKLREVASVQRQFLQLLLLHYLAHAGDGGLNQRGIGAHQYLLFFRSYSETCRDRSRLVHVERDAILHIFLESSRRDLQAVVPDREFLKDVVTVVVSGRLP